jgi:hypothetical protein
MTAPARAISVEFLGPRVNAMGERQALVQQPEALEMRHRLGIGASAKAR